MPLLLPRPLPALPNPQGPARNRQILSAFVLSLNRSSKINRFLLHSLAALRLEDLKRLLQQLRHRYIMLRSVTLEFTLEIRGNLKV